MQDFHREVIWRLATHTGEKKVLFCSRSVGSISLKWSSKETHTKSVVQDLQREVIWRHIWQHKTEKKTTFFARSVGQREVIWRYIWQHIPEKKKTFFARSVGQFFPKIQVYIMKKSHLGAKSAVQDLHREVIWRHIWQLHTGAGFSKSDNLKRHIQTHTGEGPFNWSCWLTD